MSLPDKPNVIPESPKMGILRTLVSLFRRELLVKVFSVSGAASVAPKPLFLRRTRGADDLTGDFFDTVAFFAASCPFKAPDHLAGNFAQYRLH